MVYYTGQEAIECVPRKAAEEAAEDSKIEPREPPGAFGLQLGDSWHARPLRKRSWAVLGSVLAALGPLLAPLWAVLVRPGGPREVLGGSGEGLREAIVAFFGGQAEEAAAEVGKSLKIASFP